MNYIARPLGLTVRWFGRASLGILLGRSYNQSSRKLGKCKTRAGHKFIGESLGQDLRTMSDVISRLTDLFEDISKSLLFELKAEAQFEILVETCWALWHPFFCIGVLEGGS